MFSSLSGWLFGRKSTTSSAQTATPTKISSPRVFEEDSLYEAPDFDIDDYRPLKVRCIGAGFSGIACALRY